MINAKDGKKSFYLVTLCSNKGAATRRTPKQLKKRTMWFSFILNVTATTAISFEPFVS